MNFTKNIRKAYKWILNNTVNNKAIAISNKQHVPYDEVSGYFIPTLLDCGNRALAKNYANDLVSKQRKEGWWGLNNDPYIFDTAQIIDGLYEFGVEYKENITRACDWILSQSNNGVFKDCYNGTLSHILHMRTLYCLKKCGIDISSFIPYYSKFTDFDCLSHFWAYAFEASARLGLDCSKFLSIAKQYGGKIPERKGMPSYCFAGLSQTALSLFLTNEFDLGMKTLEFVSSFQKDSGGFDGSNGKYFPNEEMSWGVKFYLDAFFEGQKSWFRKNLHIFAENFEAGEKDSRYNFVKKNIQRGEKVLDLGCGKGRYINRLDCNRYACDVADASKYIHGDFKIGSLLRTPYEDNFFDKIIMCESFEHAVLHDNCLLEARRILKPTGQILIIDKDDSVKFNGLHFGEEWINTRDLINKYGAKVEKLQFIGFTSEWPFFGAKIGKK